jgi:hypothetical protein
MDSYTFLGTIITRDGSMSKEINRRISSGRLATIKQEKIMKAKEVMATTKSKIVETMIFPIVTYGSKSWAFARKTVKWWKKLFFRLFDLVAVNAHILHNKSSKEKKVTGNVL